MCALVRGRQLILRTCLPAPSDFLERTLDDRLCHALFVEQRKARMPNRWFACNRSGAAIVFGRSMKQCQLLASKYDPSTLKDSAR